ncbi:LacI family DNA-binding transcriptional regulator [Microbacterium saperdae]|uniref:LacI family transcriptional regulator n=1 Tax=Microbacterium saperdae TaxID=69368 RepID=A0A543BL06_9MICO|nr:LacI family DNA-binding transcriptional regulator [Microbacterium saperdae]TQL85473.1 LacI family transcriptional regulator [Microbacterium saperdae]GGM63498.1 LacI family transcriptional regulator [Microbacterium saperdae]
MANVGIRQVAEAANVSVGTVSNVLNRPDYVAPATLAKVQATMERLGFVRNNLARQVKLGESTSIAMVVLNVANPFFGGLASACVEAAERRGHTIVLGTSDQHPDREDRYIDLFEGQRVKGMLVTPLNGFTTRMGVTRNRRMPLVLFDDASADWDCCSVAMDGRLGGRIAVTHLIDRGRRDIVFIGGPLSQVHDRWAGAQDAVRAVEGVRFTHMETADQRMADGREAGMKIATLPPELRPDAIFAANDLLALGVMQALLATPGISVPDDIAVIGYDDIEYGASAALPLTTVRQPLDALADAAVSMILSEAADFSGHTHTRLLLPPELIVRSST